ncbi:hypothetical protein T11_5137 [Trichinella zimbabwensis]|uniref:Uncharacterized protein n=1 Tax=Trichinella zimbabwensis TaxID=268475 RepID=A0A0V1GKH1_9BILA|nr:hypothetical protein T11_5137 [Trichinella zimbabwensis]
MAVSVSFLAEIKRNTGFSNGKGNCSLNKKEEEDKNNSANYVSQQQPDPVGK